MLSWAEYRLLTWSKQSGLYNDNLRCSPKELALIHGTLGEIEASFSDTGHLKAHYKLDLRPSTPEVSSRVPADARQTVDAIGDDTVEEILIRKVPQEERVDLLLRAKLIKSANALPKRLFWAKCDKDNFHALVKDLHKYIDQLDRFLDAKVQTEMRENLQKVAAKAVEMEQHIPGLLRLAETLKLAEGVRDGRNTDSVVDLPSIAHIKAQRMALGIDLEHDMTTGAKTPRPEQGTSEDSLTRRTGQVSLTASATESIVLRSHDLVRTDENVKMDPSMEFATYEKQTVFVEWKDVKKSTNIRKLKPRVQNLGRLLKAAKSPSFRSLHCRGVVELIGRNRFGLVSDIPEGFGNGGTSMPLLICLMWSHGIRPSATFRKDLACSLSETMLYLHLTGWVHKGIRSENIRFFFPKPPPTTSGVFESSQPLGPYLMGYEYARFDSPSEMSEVQSASPQVDVYRHPALLDAEPCTFTREYDVYALGLVLLELGFWRPLAAIIKPFVDIEQEPHDPRVRGLQGYLLGWSDDGKSAQILPASSDGGHIC